MLADVVRMLEDERDRIDRALLVLSVGVRRRGRPRGSVSKTTPAVETVKKDGRSGTWTPERRASQAKRLKIVWKKKGKAAFNKGG